MYHAATIHPPVQTLRGLAAAATAPPATRPPRILYAAGPGDVIGTYRHWKSGTADPSQVHLTYSGQFYDLCRALDAEALVISANPNRRRLIDGRFRFEDRPIRFARSIAPLFYFGQLWYAARLLVTAASYGADVAVVGGGVQWFTLSPLRWLGVRVVPSLHCALWPAGQRPRGVVKRIIQALDARFWRRRASATVCVSGECERQVRELCAPPAPRGRIFQSRAQYRHGWLDQVPPPQWPDVNHGETCRVLYTGRVEREKGVFDVLEMARRLEQRRPGRFEWDVCGDGAERESLARAASDAGLSSIFHVRGHLGRDDLLAAYASAHVVVVPTTSDFTEGLNKSAVEGALAGRPVVTSRLSHALDALGAAAIEVPPNDVAAYADAIERLASDPEQYEQARAACAAVAEPFYDPARSWREALRRALAAAGVIDDGRDAGSGGA